MIHLQGHTALITGSTKGVGRSIAEAFAAAGANVVLHGRSRDANAGSAGNCKAKGAEFVTLI
jgi:NAD(P)-dependent dehydrogenase (short-subunit alcohol dehydrogenase family)